MSARDSSLRDARLPGLGVALDPGALLAELAGRLCECRAGAELVAVTASDVQYRPGQGASVLLRLELRDGARTLRPRACLLVLPLGEAPPPLAELAIAAHRRRCDRPGGREFLRTPVEAWPELGLFLFAFPLDPRLPSLAEAFDPELLREALQRAWRPRGVVVRSVEPSLLSYVPGSRAAMRLEVLAEDEASGAPELRRLVGKVQRRRLAEELFAGHWAVWRAVADRGVVAPPVGFVATSGLSLQELVEGRRLSALAGGAGFAQAVRRTATALPAVSATVLPLSARRDAAQECRTVERWVRVVGELRPDLRSRLERHGARLQAELVSRFRPGRTVHSDFHLANVLVGAGGVTLLDWDQVAQGDPALDAGRFLGALRIAALRVTGEVRGFADVGASFLETYLARSDEDERQVRLFEAVALMIAAASPFRLQREGWREQAELLVAESEAALTRATSRPPLPPGREGSRALSLEGRRDWALDRQHARALLSPLLRERDGVVLEVTGCEASVLRLSSGLLQVGWSLSGSRGEEAWGAAVEGIGLARPPGAGLVRRLRAVREAALGVPGCLGLPKPLGYLAATSLLVIEPVAGAKLAERLSSPDGGLWLDRLGRALAAMSGVRVELDRSFAPGREARALARRLDRLDGLGAGETSRWRNLLALASAAAAAGPPCVAPTLHRLTVEDLVVDGERISARVVRDLVAAPAGAAVAGLLAQLRSAPARERLRAAFLSAAGLEERELAGQEALMLLQRAGRRLLSQSGGRRAGELLAAAEERLAAVS